MFEVAAWKKNTFLKMESCNTSYFMDTYILGPIINTHISSQSGLQTHLYIFSFVPSTVYKTTI